jgi:1-acyl-sn-glycerol-3-phosphate acyltransferase
VPTEESGLAVTAEEKERMRRISAERFIEAGRDALTAEFNLLICPEGQSQKAEDSPARFFSGAFRLAQQCEREPLIVPIALAGFDRRYKHTKLVASIEKPFRLSALLGDRDPKALRPFLDRYRLEFAEAVRGAEQRSRMTDPVDTDTATAAKAISLLASS